MRRALVRRCVLQRKVSRQLHKCRMAEKSPKPLLLLHEAGVESESFLIPCVISLPVQLDLVWMRANVVRANVVRANAVRANGVRASVCVCVFPFFYTSGV